MNLGVRQFQKEQFLKIIFYHQKYFEASAWSVLAIDRFQKAKDEGRNMGIAAGTAQHSVKLF